MVKLETDDDLKAFVEYDLLASIVLCYLRLTVFASRSILDGNLCLQPKALIRVTPDDATISKAESSSSTKPLESEKDDKNSSCN